MDAGGRIQDSMERDPSTANSHRMRHGTHLRAGRHTLARGTAHAPASLLAAVAQPCISSCEGPCICTHSYIRSLVHMRCRDARVHACTHMSHAIHMHMRIHILHRHSHAHTNAHAHYYSHAQAEHTSSAHCHTNANVKCIIHMHRWHVQMYK